MKAFRLSPIRRAALLALAPAIPVLSHAQAALKEVVVTATRTETRADELVSDVRVIGREAIEASTARSLPELLARTAGVQMAANGGRGKLSSVFIRGGENRHAILLVDGVRVGSATAGIPIWDNIPVEMIERIEVVKGPASALYGSDGVAGVVHVFLRKGRAGFHPYASITAGSRGHLRAGAGLQGGEGKLAYSLGVQRLRERGASSTNARVPFGQFNPDIDPFRQDSVNANARYEFAPDWSVDAALMHSDGTSWFDDGPGFDSRSAVRATTFSAGVKGRLMGGWLSELRFAEGRDTNNTIEGSFPGAFKTTQRQWTWQNTVASPWGSVVAGLERRVQSVDATTAYTVMERTIDSAYAGINGSAGRHSWQGNVRHDGNSQFGSANTWFAAYGFRIAPQWRIHASHGTSFVAPSFNQLYFPMFGNPDLQPERGRNTDIGIAWSANGHEVKLVRFDNRIRGFMTNTTLPVNVPRARIEGWTLAYDGQVGPVALHASADAIDPRNETNGRQLPRRAKEQVTIGADYSIGAWKFGANLLHVGDRWDDPANSLPLAAYTTVDLRADWQVAPALVVQAKVNNATGREYETAYGYNQPGRSFYLTLRWQPK